MRLRHPALVLFLVTVLMGVNVVLADEGPRPRPLFPAIWVDDGTRGCDGNFPCYQSIVQAINDLTDGGTITILGSTQAYLENPIVSKSATIVGESRANTTIDGRFAPFTVEVTAGPVTLANLTITNAVLEAVHVSAPSTTIRNVQIAGAPIGVEFANSPFGLLEGTTILNPDGGGVLAASSDNLRIDNVTILGGGRGITVTNSAGFGLTNSLIDGSRAGGLSLGGVANPTIGPGNVVSNGAGRGIWVNGSTIVRVLGNSVVGNALSGVNISASVGVLVADNVISGNGASGIPPRGPGPAPSPLQGSGGGLRFWQTDPVFVTNNTVDANHFFGIGIGGPLSTDYFLDRNRANGNLGVGLFLGEGAARIDVAGNFTSNVGDGIAMDNVSAISVHNATIEGNGAFGVRGQFAVDVSVVYSLVQFNGLGFGPKASDGRPWTSHGGGMRFWQTDPSEVRNNTIRENDGPGVALVQTADFSIVNNTIANHTGNGVTLDHSTRTSALRNRVTSVPTAFEILGGDATLALNFLANASTGIALRDRAAILAENDTFEATTNEFSLEGGSRAIALNETLAARSFALVDDVSNLTLRWFLNATVLDADGNRAGNATVRVLDAFGTQVFNGTADSQGEARWVVLTEADFTRPGPNRHTPHEVQAYVVGPDLGVASATMDRSQTVIVRLYRDDTAPTVGPVFADPTPQEQFLAVNVSTTVQDAAAVTVYLNVTYPDGTWLNETMSRGASDVYYRSRTYGQVGGHAVVITAVDSWGNVALRTGGFSIVPPNPSPVITNVAAVPDPQEAGGTVNVSATVTDADGLAFVTVLFLYPSGSSIFRFMSPWSGNVWYYEDTYTELGTYAFTITATDTNATIPKSSNATGSFVVQDTTPPVANAGPDQTVPEGTVVQFQGNGSSDNLGILSYVWTFDDQGPRTLSGVSPTYLFPRIGAFVVTLTVTDLLGNFGTDAMTVTVEDVTAPQITGLAADPSPAESPGTTNVSFAVVEANTVAVARIELYDPADQLLGNLTASYDAGTGRYFRVWSLMALGTYRFVAYAEDQSGNWATVESTVLARDSIPPVITASGADPVTQQVQSAVVLWAQASDAFLVGLAVEVREPLGPVVANVSMAYNAAAGRYEASHSPVSLGAYTFTVWAFDTSGNALPAPGSFVSVDTISPSIGSLAVIPQPLELGGSADVSVTASDDYSVVRVWMDLTDPLGSAAGSFDLVFSSTDNRYHDARSYGAPGTWTFVAWVEDPGGNRASVPGEVVVVDRFPPTVGPIAKDPLTWEAGGTINVSAAVTDNVGLRRVSLQVLDPSGASVGNHTMTCAGGVCWFARAYGLTGVYTLRVWAEDTSENFGYAEGTLQMVPGEAPIANAGPDITIDAGGTVAFNGSGSSDDFAVLTYTWRFTYGGREETLPGATPSFRFDTPGTYTVTLTVVDIGGKTGTDTVVVIVRSPPGLSPVLLGGLLVLLLLAAAMSAVLVRRRRSRRSQDEKPESSREPEARREEPSSASPAKETARPTITDAEIDKALDELEELDEL